MKRLIRPVSLVLLFALTVSSCAAQYGSGWLSDAEQSTHDGYGAYVRVEYDAQYVQEGELLAVSKDSLYMITMPPYPAFAAYGRRDITNVLGNTYDRGSYAIFALYGFVGPLLSIFTTGFYFALLTPLYIIASIIGGIVAARVSRISYSGNEDEWSVLRSYARFPSGLPPSYNRHQARTKLKVEEQ